MEEELQQVMREWTPLAQFRADYVHVGRSASQVGVQVSVAAAALPVA